MKNQKKEWTILAQRSIFKTVRGNKRQCCSGPEVQLSQNLGSVEVFVVQDSFLSDQRQVPISSIPGLKISPFFSPCPPILLLRMSVGHCQGKRASHDRVIYIWAWDCYRVKDVLKGQKKGSLGGEFFVGVEQESGTPREKQNEKWVKIKGQNTNKKVRSEKEMEDKNGSGRRWVLSDTCRCATHVGGES